MENDMATEPPPFPSPSPSQQLPELIQTLDHATQMAKQIPAANPDHHRLILSSLHSAQLSLSSFLSLHHYSPADEMMMTEDGNAGEEEQDSSMERVEEKMRESLCIQNKRLKRPLSPSTAAGRGVEERENVRVPADYDPYRTRLRNLELVYQFHG